VAVLSELIMHEPPLRTGATAVYAYKPGLERRFKFTSRFGEEVKLCTVDHGKHEIHLPRAVCPVGPVDLRTDGEAVVYPKRPEPRSHQVALFEETAAFLKAGLSGIVCAYTGWGKSPLGYHAAHVVGRKTLVVTTKDDIYEQWIAGACGWDRRQKKPVTNFLGLTPDEVGEIRADKCEVVGTKFCVAMIHSLSKDGKYPDWIVNGFGLVIFDECHRLPAEQFSAVADMFPARLRLGLSATPERKDGKELLVLAHIGPIRAKTEAELMVPKVLRFASAWQCPRTLKLNKETGEREVIRIPHQPGKTTHIEKMLAADQVRNRMIANLVKQALDKGRTTVVFSTLTDHLKAIHRACHTAFDIPGRQMGFYVGASTKAEKQAREREKVKPVIFATYGMMSEGTSLDWIDTCILAMPRSSVAQPIGRIRREYEGKSPPVVMDIVDQDSPVFNAYAAGRLSWYKSIGCPIKEMT
jgi:superfamily II DNA or RNA helicase